MARTRSKILSAAAIIAGLQFAATAQAEPTTLKFGFNQGSVTLFQSLGFKVAMERGFLEKEDITLDVHMLAGSYHQVEELDAGTVDVTYVAVTDLVPEVIDGSDAVAIVGGPRNPVYAMIARPDITSIDQLEGKPIAISLPADIITLAADDLFAAHNLKGYEPVLLLGSVNRAECLKAGDCAAAMLAQPFDISLAKEGYNVVGSSHEVYQDLQYTVYAARRAWAEENKELMVRFARAMGESYKYIADPANKEDVIALAVEMTGQPIEIVQELYAADYEPYNGVLPKHGEISLSGFAKVIELMHRADAISEVWPTEKFVDTQYLEAAGMQ